MLPSTKSAQSKLTFTNYLIFIKLLYIFLSIFQIKREVCCYTYLLIHGTSYLLFSTSCATVRPAALVICSAPCFCRYCSNSSAPYSTCGSATTIHGNGVSACLPFSCCPRHSPTAFSRFSTLSIARSTLFLMASSFFLMPVTCVIL